MSVETIQEEIMKAYGETLEDNNLLPVTRYIFPFPFANEFNIKIIEVVPEVSEFRVTL